MSARAKLMLFAAIVVAVACKKDKTTGPRTTAPRREALNGDYVCQQMFAFYAGPSGTGWYTGSCIAYLNTFPGRRDSIESVPFTIGANDLVHRPEFEDGALQYDSTSGEAFVTYSYKVPDEFVAEFNGSAVQLRQLFTPFDLSGDGQPDSLVLVFRRN